MKEVDIVSKIVNREGGTFVSSSKGTQSIDLSDYLLKSIWDKVFEIRTDSQGTEYIFGKLPVVTQYGITMYSGDGVDVPSLASGLPFDGRTIWYNPETQQIEVIGGTGGGVADSVAWANITGKPNFASVATSGKYDDLIGKPTLLSSFTDDVVSGKYLPLSGGTLTGHLGINASTANAGISISYNGTTMGSLSTNGSTFEMFNNDGYGITTLGKNLYALYNWNRYTLWHSGNDGSGSGLDADLLDGVQSGAFHQEFRGAIQSADINTYTTRDGGNYTVNFSGYSGMLVHFPCNYMGSVSALDLYVPHYDLKYYGLKARLSVDTSRYTDWREFAFTDSNVASATKLQTARTIWGQNFDGTGNVGGNIYMDNNVSLLWKQTDGNYVIGMQLSTSNNITIGTATAQKGYDTYISGNNVYLRYGTSPTIGLILNSSGNVGIGFVQPSHRLEVNGDGYFLSNLTVGGGITMYSDKRKKTILNHVELSLKQIAEAPLIEHYYNGDDKKTTHVGSIAQYWASMNDWFCKLDSEGYYTMEIQNAALASAISIARELDRYETKTDKAIKKLKKRICELEEEVERLKAS